MFSQSNPLRKALKLAVERHGTYEGLTEEQAESIAKKVYPLPFSRRCRYQMATLITGLKSYPTIDKLVGKLGG